MKIVRLLLLLLSLPILAACQTSTSTVSPPSASMTAEGTVVTVEEGYLLLDLPDGSRQEIGTDESIMPVDKLLSSAGRKCRVHYKSEQVEEIDGSVRTAFLMTHFEWL